MNEDLGNLSLLKEGEKVMFAGHEYKIAGGRFVMKR